jgi:hypothetical protein
MLTMCGWCKKVALPRITHGICQACRLRVEATA